MYLVAFSQVIDCYGLFFLMADTNTDDGVSYHVYW